MQATQPTVHESISEERRAAVRAELARVLSSQSFRGSRRCCRFLEYSVQHVLEGNQHDDLRERSIGIEVFHRAPDYDTNEDAIVRVTANEVRKRLAQYYQDAGDHSDPVIALPSGSYAATFRWKPATVSAVMQPTVGRSRLLLIAAAVVIVALSGVILYLARDSRSESRLAVPTSDPLWSRVFRPGQKTNIITADAARFEIGELLGREITLKEYLSPDYPNNLAVAAVPELQRVVRFMATRQTTSVASTVVGAHLLAFGKRLGGNPALRHPRHINAREFKTDNFILLGSRVSIPWVELFEAGLNFPFERGSGPNDFCLLNRSPRPDEPARYDRSAGNDDTYVDIAVLPNMEKSGTVLILNSIDMAGIEGAAQFAMDGGLSRTLSGAFASEVLLRVRSIGGAVSKAEIVATRELAEKNNSRR